MKIYDKNGLIINKFKKGDFVLYHNKKYKVMSSSIKNGDKEILRLKELDRRNSYLYGVKADEVESI